MICRAWVDREIINEEANLRSIMDNPKIKIAMTGSFVPEDPLFREDFEERIRSFVYLKMTVNMWRKNWKGYYD